MSKRDGSYLTDLQGLSRLVIDATTGVTDIVEGMHHTVQSVPFIVGKGPEGRTRGVTGLVYDSVRLVTNVVGGGLDAALELLNPLIEEQTDERERVHAHGVLNAVVGDYLESHDNPLAVQMRLCFEGKSLTLEPEALACALPQATGKLAVLVHGLGMNDQWWRSMRPDYGARLAEDLGVTPIYARYNTGRHVSLNGRQLAEQLEALVSSWPVPVEELTLIGHSMGGLVSRSAIHYGERGARGFRQVLKRLVTLGTPHHGAPLELGGNWLQFAIGISPYSAPIARLASIRSAGITDLRYGSLVDADWQGSDRFAIRRDARQHIPLPEGVRSFAVASDLGGRGPKALRVTMGDGLVPVASALGQHKDPTRTLAFAPEDTLLLNGVDHIALLAHPEILEALATWLA